VIRRVLPYLSSMVAAVGTPALSARNAPELDIASVVRMQAQGSQSCEQLVSAYLRRIANYDGSSGLNAISAINPDVIEEARALDERAGPKGPLACVPILVKDNIDLAGMATTGGSIALKDSIPPDDAEIIRRLKDAGAIMIAKTNMAEWAFSPRRTISSTHGETANAYALDRVPAGSSGGTASGVAADFAIAGLGTDTGNSIRGPSARLALVGMRSTLGLVPLDGIIPLLLDHDVAGPMTRTVEDNARMLSVIADRKPGKASATDYVAELRNHPLEGARIGIVRALANPEELAPDVQRLFHQAVADLRKRGATVIDDVTIENLERHAEEGYYCPRFRADVNAYLGGLGSQAPLKDVAEAYQTNRFAPESREQFEFFLRNAREDCPDFEATKGRQEFRADVLASMARQGVTMLIYPSWATGPARRDRANEDYRGDYSQVLAPPTGLPAITVPMGFDEEGLPAGLQILGRPYSEAELYGAAFDYEQATQHRRPPSGFPPREGFPG